MRHKIKLKNVVCILWVSATAMLGSCSSTQSAYTSRLQDVDRNSVTAEKKTAELDVDLSKRINAKSSWQLSKQQAMKEAEYLALQQSGADVIVDPLYRITTSPMFNSKDGAKWYLVNYKAEVTGFGGKYKALKTDKELIEEFKDVSLEDVEKYKLATDRNFAYEYLKAKQAGDINSQGNLTIGGGMPVIIDGAGTPEMSPVIISQNHASGKKDDINPYSLIEIDPELQKLQYEKEITKANNLVKTGKAFLYMGLPIMAAGIICVGVGYGTKMPEYPSRSDYTTITYTYERRYNTWTKSYYTEKVEHSNFNRNGYDAAMDKYNKTYEMKTRSQLAGVILAPIGAGFTIIGASCHTAGKKKLRKLDEDNLSFNFGINGYGNPALSFNF